MIHPSILLCFCTLVFQINPIFPIQQYDHTMCTSKAEAEIPNSNYLCKSKKSSCDTFIVYRAQKHYQTLNSISYLFNTTISHLLLFNNMSKNDPDNIPPDREIIVPVSCSCTDNFFKAVHLYNASSSDSVLTIACEVFEGLVNPQSLIAKNKLDSSLIEVPVKCACPDSSDIGNGTYFLVTYPVIRADNINLIARRFGVSEKMILDSNKLDHLTTIFPQTTILVPTKDVPVLNLDIISSPHVPLFGHQTTNSNKSKRSKTIKIILGAIVILFLIILIPGIYVLIRKKHYHVRIKMRVSSQLSPDLLDGMSKLKSSLICFKFEEIKNATADFSHDCVIGSTFYKGKICDSDVVIEKFNSTEVANNVVSILTKINHLNMVRLEGFCHVPKPYLVYEFVENGSLRECLNDSKKARLLTWKKRVQIATDIAVGLHYIHCCTRPNYIHRNINSKSILITADSRAKISGFKWAKSQEKGHACKEEDVIIWKKGYVAPEYLNSGHISTKMDIYAFGIVLLELLSGEEAITMKNRLHDFSGCLDTLKVFMDPVLESDYCLRGAMCLTLLAKGCIEEDFLQRPSITHVLKALSSIVSCSCCV